MFETGVIGDNECLSGHDASRDKFSIFFNVKVCCVFSLESSRMRF